MLHCPLVMCTCQAFWSSSQLAKSRAYISRHIHMVAEHGHFIYLTQQLNAVQTHVAELQNGLQGSATRFADLTVQLFTSEPRVRRVIEAGDEATAVTSRLQDLETRSTGAMTSVAQRFRGKEATDYKPQTWSGEKRSESFTLFKMELQSWVGSLHDNVMKVMDVAETKEGKLMELDTRNAGMSQETEDDFMHQRRSEELRMQPWKIGIQGVDAKGHFDPRTGADRSVAYARVTHPVSQSGLTSGPRTLQSARNIIQTWRIRNEPR